MNITALLHHEMMLVARARVSKNYNEPTFTVQDELAMLRADRESNRDSEAWPMGKSLNIFLTRSKKYIPRPKKSLSSSREQACQHYISTATLIEYQQLYVEIDNAVYRIFEAHKFGQKDPQIQRFFKYYKPIVKECKPEEKMVAARYAFLRVLDELDQENTFGLTWRPDAADRKYNAQKNELARKISSRSKVEQYLREQRENVLNPSYESVDGVLVSAYSLLMGE